jgi:N-acetylglucosaminyldiphosphoundecaprenol N-acetyl-beta-D-mannosaminyltransferase
MKVMNVLSKVYINDIAFHNVTMQEAVARIVQMAQKTEKPRYVCTGNLDHLVTLAHDPEFREIYQNSDLTLADGKPIVLLSRLAATPTCPALKQRVTGSDLFWELARASEATGLRLFFLGGAPCAADLAREAVLKLYPGAQICGTYCPPFETFASEAEQVAIREAVTAAQPDILLVGFGAPKQEKWIVANKDLLSVPVSIGVGGSFEMAGGVVKRAPSWMQDCGLEWAYRFMQEPSRLWHRYFVRDLPFFAKLVWQTLLDRRDQQVGTARCEAEQIAP